MLLQKAEHFSYTMDPHDTGRVPPEEIIGSPIEVLGMWMETHEHHGPIVRLFSEGLQVELISFVSARAMILAPLRIMQDFRDVGVRIPTGETAKGMKTTLKWVLELQNDAKEAARRAAKGYGINVPLPGALAAPLTTATLRPNCAPQSLALLPSLAEQNIRDRNLVGAIFDINNEMNAAAEAVH